MVHFHEPTRTIQSWSRAVGLAYESEVLWGAHGAASGRGPVDPYWRPGWRVPLGGPYSLAQPVSLARLREMSGELAAIRRGLEEDQARRPIYFPFVAYGSDGALRAFQSYLTKLPRAVIDAVPELSEVAMRRASPGSTSWAGKP